MAEQQKRVSIPAVSSLRRRTSNLYAGYCRACSSSAVKCGELYSQFNTMRQEGELCDIVISVKSSSCNLTAHRLILATKSPFFKRHFTENKTATEFEFDESFSADGVKSILEHLYENELIVLPENVEALTKIAVFLELSDIVDRCCQLMTSSFSISNYEHYISLTEELNVPWLLDKVFLFMECNFVEIVENEGFVRLKAKQLYRLLCSKGLRVGREETLYEAVMKWYNYDTTKRKTSLESLFENVHSVRMSPKFLEERVILDLVQGLGICEDKVTSSAQGLQQMSPSHVDTWQQGRSRNTSDVIYVFASSDGKVERFDQVRSTCVSCPQMNRGASLIGDRELRYAVKVNENLFLVSSRRVLRFSARDMCWATVGEGFPVAEAAVCGGEFAIFVVGGKKSKDVKRFLIEEENWDGLPPMNTGRRGPGVVYHSNTLYVFGGYSTDLSAPIASVEKLDLGSSQWSSLPPMRVARFRLSCVTLDGKIFAMGGRDNVRSFVTVETLDIESKRWDTPANHMVQARDEFCAVVLDGMIFCFGGRGEQNIECYDPNAGGVWKEIGVIGEGRFRTGLSCATFSPLFDDCKKTAY